MTKPIVDDHRPYANPFPAGVALMRKANAMASHYTWGRRFGALMTLRESSGLENKSSRARIKVCFHHFLMILFLLRRC